MGEWSLGTNASGARRACRAAVIAAALALGAPPNALAQNAPDAAAAARADQLFKHARQLMGAGRFQEACPELEESQRIDPAPGTLLNLADCYEKSGLLASAWGAYRALLPEARRLGQSDRERYASERSAALEKRASRLSLEFAPGTRVEELRVELDGKQIDSAALSASFPVDGGAHRLRVSAAGHEPWFGDFTLAREKEKKTLQVPALRPAATIAAPSAAAASVSFDAAASSSPGERDPRPVGPAIYALGGVTIALAAGAGVTGGLALGKANDFEDANEDPSRSREERQELRDSATNLALVSTVLTGAAVAGAGVTLYLYLTRPTERAAGAPQAARLQLSPWATPGGAGLGVSGAL